MSNLKIKLLKLLLNNIFKYNKNECREKWLETTIDDLTYLLNNIYKYNNNDCRDKFVESVVDDITTLLK